MTTNVAVIFSGCGYLDGTEIREAVISLLALEENGARYQCFAPDKAQSDVIDHLNQGELDESRNSLHEAARIARGKIKSIESLNVEEFDMLLIPGGFGSAKTLSNFARARNNFQVDSKISQIIKIFYEERKPICALCISPILVAGSLEGIKLTIGDNADIAAIIEETKNIHKKADRGEVVIDEVNKVITTPCYMYDDIDLVTVHRAVDKAVKAALTLIN